MSELASRRGIASLSQSIDRQPHVYEHWQNPLLSSDSLSFPPSAKLFLIPYRSVSWDDLGLQKSNSLRLDSLIKFSA